MLSLFPLAFLVAVISLAFISVYDVWAWRHMPRIMFKIGGYYAFVWALIAAVWYWR